MKYTKNKNRRSNRFSKKNRRYNKFSKKNRRYNRFTKKKAGGLPFFRKKSEDEIILEKSKRAGIAITNNITKNELFNMLIIQCCILYNEYIDIPNDKPDDEKKKTRLYKEELIPIIKSLKEIFKRNSDILNDHLGSDIFGKPIVFVNKEETGITTKITQETKALLTNEQIESIATEETKEEIKIIEEEESNANQSPLQPTATLPLPTATPPLSQESPPPPTTTSSPSTDTPPLPPPPTSTTTSPPTNTLSSTTTSPPTNTLSSTTTPPPPPPPPIDENEDIPVTNDVNVRIAVPEKSKINELVYKLTEDMQTKEFTIKTKINGENPIKFEAGITYFIPFVEFLCRFIKLLEDCIDNEIIQEAGIEGKERMMQGRVILAKSKTYRSTGIPYVYNYVYKIENKKFGGGIISSMSAAIKQKYRDLKTASMQFISKADEHVKQKYSYLLYFDTFIDMFNQNTTSNYALSKESFTLYDKIRNGKGTWSKTFYSKWQDIKEATKSAASLIYRNKFLGTFNSLLWLAADVACVAAAPYPVLIPAAVALTAGHWVILVASAPFLAPPAIIIYKKEEIDKANKSIQNNTMKNLIDSVNSYRKIIHDIFGNRHDYGEVGVLGKKISEFLYKIEGDTTTTSTNPLLTHANVLNTTNPVTTTNTNPVTTTNTTTNPVTTSNIQKFDFNKLTDEEKKEYEEGMYSRLNDR